MNGEDDSSQTGKNDDLYHRGVITKLFPSNNTGFVRTESGRELPFSFAMVILHGEAKSVSELHEGEGVGYDLGWTSSGLQITKIKTYPRSSDPGTQSGLEGQSR